MWSLAKGITPLGFINATDTSSSARAVSANGSIVVGFSSNTPQSVGAFWNAASAAGTPTGHSDTPGSTPRSNLFATSHDGDIHAGRISNEFNGFDAVTWTQADGYTPLGNLGFGPVS
ncbi:MAG: hypothetical protein ACYTF7_03660 [Planctomycetota bacterium]